MITNAPMLFSLFLKDYSLFCMNSGLLILAGLYYGFLSTLPLGPSQLLYLRALLLEGNGSENDAPGTVTKSGIVIAAISGLTMAHLLLFVSISWEPLSFLWTKPHILTLFVLPYMFFFWYRIKNFEKNFYFHITHPIYNPKVQATFFDSFFFQALNPVIFPSALLTRLMSLFMFRYHNSNKFIFGTIIGYLSGQTIFVLLSWLLLIRLEQDTPTVYVIAKRLIHRVFPPIMFFFCLTYLGRFPVAFFSKKKSLPNTQEFSMQSSWPCLAFDITLWNRPFRFAKKDKINEEETIYNNKKRFSQYVFEICVNDGKRRLSHTYPQSLILFQSKMNACLNIAHLSQQHETDIYDEWLKSKQNRKFQLYEMLSNKILKLDQGLPISKVIENKNSSYTLKEQIANSHLDPRLGQYLRASKAFEADSPWGSFKPTVRQAEIQDHGTNFAKLLSNNQLQNWLYIKSQQLDKIATLPLEQMNYHSNLVFNQILQKSSINKESWENVFSIDKTAFLQNRIKSTTPIYGREKIWLCLQDWFYHLYLQSILNKNQTNFDVLKTTSSLSDIYKTIPIWYIKEDEESSDIKFPKKRFKKAAFSRRIVKGAIRSKRRNAIIWAGLQFQLQTPFLVRVNKISSQKASFKLIEPVSQISSSNQDSYASKTATRFDFRMAHLVRSPVLIAQSIVRKYVKIPLLIIFKNCARFLLLQKTEWSQDFEDWNREIYVTCSYDSTEIVSSGKFTTWWLKGIQIRILFPFRLKPWHPSTNEISENSTKIETKFNRIKNQILENSSYLTIWGNETEVPFGRPKTKPSFWKPTLKAIQLTLDYQLKKFGIKIKTLFSPVDTLYQTYILGSNYKEDSLQQQKELSINSNESILKIENKTTIQNELNKPNNIQETHILHEINLANTQQKSVSKNGEFLNEFSVIENEHHFILVLKLKEEKKQNSKKVIDLLHKLQNQSNQNELIKKKIQLTNQNSKSREPFDSKTLLEQEYYIQPIFNIRLISYKSLTLIRYKIIKIQSLFLDINKKWFYFKEKLSNILFKTIYITKYYIIQGIQTISFFLIKFDNYSRNTITHFIRQLIYELNELLYNSNTLIKNCFSSQTIYVKKIINYNNSMKLTQAYILHKIWETQNVVNPKLSLITNIWKSNEYLNNSLQTHYVKQGLFKTTPIDLNEENWSKWLECLPYYSPSYYLWSNIVPQLWKQQVSVYWNENPNLLVIEAPVITNMVYDKTKGLFYHKPLFEKGEKLLKRWRFNMLMRKYTNNIYNYLPKIESQHQNNYRNGIKHVNKGQKSITLYQKEKYPSSFQLVQWGFMRARTQRFAPLFMSSLNTLSELAVEDTDSTSIVLDSLETNFYPVHVNKWKSRNIKEKLRKFLQTIGFTFISKKNLSLISENSSFANNKKNFLLAIENMQTNGNYNSIQKSLLLDILGNWRVKIMDDQFYIYSLINPILKFITESQKNFLFQLCNCLLSDSFPQQNLCSLISLTPEELLLSTNMQELRIMENLNLGSNLYGSKNDNNTSLNKSYIFQPQNQAIIRDAVSSFQDINTQNDVYHKENTINEHTFIRRFLWPSYALEDLACMNRFWLQVCNQSRFVTLRTSMYFATH